LKFVARLILDDWPFGSTICVLGPFIQVTSVYVSTLSMTMIALDRYQVLLSPLKTRLSRKIPKFFIISFIWFVASLLSIPHAIFNRTVELFTYKRIIRCRTIYPEPKDFYRKSITALTILTQYLLPLAIIMFTYVIISIEISRRVSIGEVTKQQITSRLKSKRKTIKMLILVVIVFAICWLPINLYHLLNDFYLTDFSLNTFYFVHWLAMSSVCYNPFIYFWLNNYYREGIKRIFCCRKFNCTNNSSVTLNNRLFFWPRISKNSLNHRSDNSILLLNRNSSNRKSNLFTANSLQNFRDNCDCDRNNFEKSKNNNINRKLSRIPTLTTTIAENNEL
jgi:hypothetical protein